MVDGLGHGVSETESGSGFLEIHSGLLLDSTCFLSGTALGESMSGVDFNAVEADGSESKPDSVALDDWLGRFFMRTMPGGGEIRNPVDSVESHSVHSSGTGTLFAFVLGLRSRPRMSG